MFAVCIFHIIIFYFITKTETRIPARDAVHWLNVIAVSEPPRPPPLDQHHETAPPESHVSANAAKLRRAVAPHKKVNPVSEQKILFKLRQEIVAADEVIIETKGSGSMSPATHAGTISSHDTLIESALKMAGKVDRDLRDRKMAPLKAATESRFQRFEKALEDAYIDKSTHERRLFMELPDGTTYYSLTKNGKTQCLMTGSVDASGKGGSGSPIACPSSFSGWSQY